MVEIVSQCPVAIVDKLCSHTRVARQSDLHRRQGIGTSSFLPAINGRAMQESYHKGTDCSSKIIGFSVVFSSSE